MKPIKKFAFATLATVTALAAATLLFQTSTSRADGEGQRGGDHDQRSHDGHTLHLRVKFVDFRSITNGLFTWGGTLAPLKHPDLPVGTFGVHFVRTTPAPVGPETLLHGVLRLPDGSISFSGLLLPEDSVADANGVKNRYAAITGGTGDYRHARGELNHRTTATAAEEFILNFSGH